MINLIIGFEFKIFMSLYILIKVLVNFIKIMKFKSSVISRLILLYVGFKYGKKIFLFKFSLFWKKN